MAADPANPERLMACTMLLTGGIFHSETVTYNSFDGGQTWALTLRVQGENGPSWDPDCAYGPDGLAYSLSEGTDSSDAPYLRIDRSPDGGRTWTGSRRVAHFERTFLTIDRTAGPRRGWLYLHGQEGVRTYSGAKPEITGLGLHQLAPNGDLQTQVVVPGGDSYVIGAGPGVVLSDGTFVGIFPEITHYWDEDGAGRPRPNVLGRRGDAVANASLKIVRLPRGERRPTVVTVADFFSPWGDLRVFSLSMIPTLAADASDGPFRDRIYAVWPDLRSGRAEVLLAYSADGGRTWSSPRIVNDDGLRLQSPHGPDHLQPVVAVNSAGVVGVMWYDRRERPNELGWDVRFTASLDGGETFLPSVKVSERPHELGSSKQWSLEAIQLPAAPGMPVLTTLGLDPFSFSGGHTAGNAADANGVFHPLWASGGSGTMQLWTAPVRVEGRALQHGDTALAGQTEVSEFVKPEFANGEYDREQKLLAVDLMVRNEGTDTVYGPIHVRLLELRSELGVATLLDAGSGRSGPGAIWRFADELDRGVLGPGAVSRPKRIRFRVTEVGPLRPSLEGTAGLVTTSTRVFAQAVAKRKADAQRMTCGSAGQSCDRP